MVNGVIGVRRAGGEREAVNQPEILFLGVFSTVWWGPEADSLGLREGRCWFLSCTEVKGSVYPCVLVGQWTEKSSLFVYKIPTK